MHYAQFIIWFIEFLITHFNKPLIITQQRDAFFVLWALCIPHIIKVLFNTIFKWIFSWTPSSLTREIYYFTEDQLDTIQNELSNYVPHGQNYKNQFIELDAFGFAEFIINVCFGVKCLYNETFSDDELKNIYNKASEFKNIYLEDKIEECMAFAHFKPIKKDFC